jgi:hypothetical protein
MFTDDESVIVFDTYTPNPHVSQKHKLEINKVSNEQPLSDRANLIRTMDLTALVTDRVLNMLFNSISWNLQCLERRT